jgi:hypothetical protein
MGKQTFATHITHRRYCRMEATTQQYGGRVTNRLQSLILGGTSAANNLIGHVGVMKISVYQRSFNRTYSHVLQAGLSCNRVELQFGKLGLGPRSPIKQNGVKTDRFKSPPFGLTYRYRELTRCLLIVRLPWLCLVCELCWIVKHRLHFNRFLTEKKNIA